MSSPKTTEKPSRSHSAKRTNKILSPANSQDHIGDEDFSTAQLKGDRMCNATKLDEDRRRRTIIVEKKNGTYGFTLQSYGIHYKKEQEIEMITYVDYIEYDGPAYKAGMREGDVILSINGQDMEKADHKALVNFIKNCDGRMRMVVLFEDCVRKVELHIRYIQLQRILQSKTAELDMLCLKEREVLQGKWKSHSLPARKKGNSSGPQGTNVMGIHQDEPYCRPTVSIENMSRNPSQSQIFLAYQCLGNRHSSAYPSDTSNECLTGEESRPMLSKANGGSKQSSCAGKDYHRTNGPLSADTARSKGNAIKPKHLQYRTKQLCNPCMQAINNQDNASLEAYDLASPCCDPRCVPSAKKKSKPKQRRGSQGKPHECDTSKENIKCRISQKASKKPECLEEVHKSNHAKSHNYLSSLMSQFSLNSCTSNDISNGTTENSGMSYATSLSSDTLYWDKNDSKSNEADKQLSYCRMSRCKGQSSGDGYQTFQPIKPKSWDNLTTKAFGGYGYGYGYVDASGVSCKAQSSRAHAYSHPGNSSSASTMPARVKTHAKANGMINLNQINFKSKTDGKVHTIQIYHNGHRGHGQSAKSNENLVLLKKSECGSNNGSSRSCECLEIGSATAETRTSQIYVPSRPGEIFCCQQQEGLRQSNANPRRGSVKQIGNVSRL